MLALSIDQMQEQKKAAAVPKQPSKLIMYDMLTPSFLGFLNFEKDSAKLKFNSEKGSNPQELIRTSKIQEVQREPVLSPNFFY